MAIAPEQIGIGIGRYFTRPGTHPYDMVEWERREARITNYKDGSDAFFQPDVEFPTTWSQNATNIVAQKYFRGTLGTPERETSLKQVIDRIADTITAWGVRDGYFVDDQEGAAFRNELKYILLSQRAAFNSPVWFNIGVKGRTKSGECVLHSRRRGHDGRDSRLVQGRGNDLQGWFWIRDQPFDDPFFIRTVEGRRHREWPRQLHARCGRLSRDNKDRAGRRVAPRRWSSSTPTIRTLKSSSGARRSKSARHEHSVTRGSTWTSTVATATRSSTRTRTTRCASPTSSCRPSSTMPTGT